MTGYRNVFYNNRLNCIQLWHWNDAGERIESVISAEPYLYIESNTHKDALSIFRTDLKKIKFKNNFERNKFVNETPIKRIYQNLPIEQQFLLDYYREEIESTNKLKIFYLDIETYSADGKFPTPEEASDPINVITLYDTLSEKFITWGLKKNYTKSSGKNDYIKCDNEEELLENFIKYWASDYPDVVTGWNIHGFDIPYLINRITNLLGEDEAKKLSPVQRIWLRPNASVNLKGQKLDRWIIYGISLLDYMDVYQTFTLGDRESYSLNYISDLELGEQKVVFNHTSLVELADTDWNTFIDYNVQDVNLVLRLEEKLKYLELIRNLSYKGFVQFEKAMGKVSLITGAVANQALNDGMVIPTYNIQNQKKSFEGGYVKEPVPGLYENLATFDANSLYPNTIITLNISPETKIGKITHIDDKGYHLLLRNGKTTILSKKKFEMLVENEKLSISKANVLYSQKFKGVIPKFINNLYTQRVAARDKVSEYRQLKAKETDETLKKEYDKKINNNQTLSEVYKVVLNSSYGVFAQVYSPFFDIDHAESITITGQSAVKEGAKIIYEKFLKDGVNCKYDDVVRYSDTDSCFIDFTELLKLKGLSLAEDRKVLKPAYDLINSYGDHLNIEIQEWAKRELKSVDPRYVFKREKICDVAVLQKKKFYILHILDNDGVPCNKFLYKGIEVAKSIMSKEVKDLIKNIIELSILSGDKKISSKLFVKTYEDFCKLSEELLSFRKKVNNYQKGEDGFINGIFAKGTPNHTKAAINYNLLLKKLNLEDSYPKIGNGNKFKYFYCLKNKFGFENMACLEEFPKEFREYIKPDYKKMFEKVISPVVGRVYTIIGWPNPKVGHEQQTDIFDLLA